MIASTEYNCNGEKNLEKRRGNDKYYELLLNCDGIKNFSRPIKSWGKVFITKKMICISFTILKATHTEVYKEGDQVIASP